MTDGTDDTMGQGNPDRHDPPWIKPAADPASSTSPEEASATAGDEATKLYPESGKTAQVPQHQQRVMREAIGADAVARRTFELRLEEANLAMQVAANKLRQMEDDSARFMTHEQREELAHDIDVLSRRAATTRRRCAYCRKELTKPLGACATCGREVCAECGQLLDKAVVHRGNCAMFYEQKK